MYIVFFKFCAISWTAADQMRGTWTGWSEERASLTPRRAEDIVRRGSHKSATRGATRSSHPMAGPRRIRGFPSVPSMRVAAVHRLDGGHPAMAAALPDAVCNPTITSKCRSAARLLRCMHILNAPLLRIYRLWVPGYCHCRAACYIRSVEFVITDIPFNRTTRVTIATPRRRRSGLNIGRIEDVTPVPTDRLHPPQGWPPRSPPVNAHVRAPYASLFPHCNKC